MSAISASASATTTVEVVDLKALHDEVRLLTSKITGLEKQVVLARTTGGALKAPLAKGPTAYNLWTSICPRKYADDWEDRYPEEENGKGKMVRATGALMSFASQMKAEHADEYKAFVDDEDGELTEARLAAATKASSSASASSSSSVSSGGSSRGKKSVEEKLVTKLRPMLTHRGIAWDEDDDAEALQEKLDEFKEAEEATKNEAKITRELTYLRNNKTPIPSSYTLESLIELHEETKVRLVEEKEARAEKRLAKAEEKQEKDSAVLRAWLQERNIDFDEGDDVETLKALKTANPTAKKVKVVTKTTTTAAKTPVKKVASKAAAPPAPIKAAKVAEPATGGAGGPVIRGGNSSSASSSTASADAEDAEDGLAEWSDTDGTTYLVDEADMVVYEMDEEGNQGAKVGTLVEGKLVRA